MSQFNAGQQGQFSLAQAGMNADAAQFGAAAQNQANSLNAQLGTNTSQFNAGQANNQGQFNAGLDQQAMMANLGFANQAGSQNAQFANQNAQFNASQQDQALARQLQAAGLLGNNANSLAQNEIAAAGAQQNIGNNLYGIDQYNQLLPFQIAQMQGGLLNPNGVLNSVTGQTINASGSGTQTQSGGLLESLIGAGAQVGAAYFCDERLKRDITRIGETDGGLPLYRFKYIDADDWVIGPMAQDVQVMQPEALGPEIDGFLTVIVTEIQ
jgi:hypothetical protein